MAARVYTYSQLMNLSTTQRKQAATKLLGLLDTNQLSNQDIDRLTKPYFSTFHPLIELTTKRKNRNIIFVLSTIFLFISYASSEYKNGDSVVLFFGIFSVIRIYFWMVENGEISSKTHEIDRLKNDTGLDLPYHTSHKKLVRETLVRIINA